MPPKKGKGKKKYVEPIVKVIEQPSADAIPDKDVDLAKDSDEGFFNSCNKTIQNLVQTKNLRDAARVKKFVTILYNIHKRYVEELKINNELKPQVEQAQIKLRLALELTGNSQLAMERIKGTLAYIF